MNQYTDALATAISDLVLDAYRQGAQDAALAAPLPSAHPQRRIVLERYQSLPLASRQWTRVPMDTIHGGDHSLLQGGHIRGALGYWLFATYLRISSNVNGQGIVRFVRDIGGAHDVTGTQDWVATPGKDFVSHVWPFMPIIDRPTGIEVYQDSGSTLTLEYAQLKGIQIQ